MSHKEEASKKIHIAFSKKMGMIFSYAKKRIVEQIKSVALIILYLAFFQVVVLGIPIVKASIIAVGILLVIIGLAFFMEGLVLGLMPLGESIGIKLPQKIKLYGILIFAFILGMGVTFAEPAIGVLKIAGQSVQPWDAPLLFLMLNKYSHYLVFAVGIGVGIAVLFGMLMFLYNWSLKPFIYILVSLLTGISIWGYFDPNMNFLLGLAWDCGAVTTGPVTVPLVLALGIGISRIVSKSNSSLSGFGVVTLASAFPILTVLLLGIFFLGSVPKPMDKKEFFAIHNREKILFLFENKNQLTRYVLENTDEETQIHYFENQNNMIQFMRKIDSDPALQDAIFENKNNFNYWVLNKATEAQKSVISSLAQQEKRGIEEKQLDVKDLVERNSLAAAQAIIPLCLLLFFTFLVILREKLRRLDEILLGILFALVGMALFNIGIELGLSRLGNQVGEKLPAAMKSIVMEDQKQIIQSFEEAALVQTAIDSQGKKMRFFYFQNQNKILTIPFEEKNYDPVNKQYHYIPKIGPLFGEEKSVTGFVVILLFAFVMGYGATLAEPALNALGKTVEELSVGTFKKSLLMQSVALGVGVGILLGVVKIIWDIPLIWLLAPPYILLLFITKISSEEYVNIGWDSAGVTTGPITVPLVLAMGLGIGNQLQVVEGFGILAMASVMPILFVLLVGLYITRKQKAILSESLNNEK